MTPFRLVLGGTLALLLALMALGLNLQLGRRGLGGRRVHHLLYFLICLGTAASGLLALRAGLAWWPFAGLLALLLGVSRTRPGRAGHWRLALLIAVLYGGAAWWLW